jgi:hypothetical protein
MQPSQLNTLALPSMGTDNPATLAKAAQIPLRVVVRNTGPNLVLVAHDSGTLMNTPVTANAFKIPPVIGEDTFVLAPGEGLFAVAIGIGGEVSVAISEALPIKLEE